MADQCDLFVEIRKEQQNLKADNLEKQLYQLQTGEIPICTPYTPMGKEPVAQMGANNPDVQVTKAWHIGLVQMGDSLSHLHDTPTTIDGEQSVHDYICENNTYFTDIKDFTVSGGTFADSDRKYHQHRSYWKRTKKILKPNTKVQMNATITYCIS